MDSLTAEIARRLRSARIKCKLTQSVAATRLLMCQTAISRYELGKKSPTLATLYRFAAGYGVCVHDLIPKEHPLLVPCGSRPAKETV